MMTNYGANSWVSSFSILAGSRSGPQVLEGFSFSSSFTTPSSVTPISVMDRNDVPSGIWMSLTSSFVHVDSYCRFRMSALSFGLAWTFPFSLRGAMPLLSLRSDLKLKSRFCFGWCSWSGSPTSMISSMYFQLQFNNSYDVCNLDILTITKWHRNN